MNLNDYNGEALRTAVLLDYKFDLEHAVMGIITEAAEMVDNLKRRVVYNKPLDVVNIKEEVGDCMWYANLAIFTYETRWSEVLPDVDVDKLKEVMGFESEFEEFAALSISGAAIAATIIDKDGREQELKALTAYLGILLMIAQRYGFTLEDAAETNIAKLKARFPNKFSAEEALNRDLSAERAVLEGQPA